MIHPPATSLPGKPMQQLPGEVMKAAPALQPFSILGDDWIKKMIRLGGPTSKIFRHPSAAPAVPGMPQMPKPQQPNALAAALKP
jgi:hypothetical protein